MSTFAQVAETLRLPFYSHDTAIALTDKLQQRKVLGDAGLPMPTCRVVRPDQSVDDLGPVESDAGWPAVLKPRSAQGSRYTFLVNVRAHLEQLVAGAGDLEKNLLLPLEQDLAIVRPAR